MKIIAKGLSLKDEDDKILFDTAINHTMVEIQMGEMTFSIHQDSVIIDGKVVDCLYVNFRHLRGADRLHVLPAATNAVHLTGGR